MIELKSHGTRSHEVSEECFLPPLMVLASSFSADVGLIDLIVTRAQPLVAL